MTKEIPLTRGYVTIVDDDLYEWLTQWKWFACGADGHVYARTRQKGTEGSKNVSMHRLVINAPDEYDVHHVNGNTLCNTRANLTVVTRKEHMALDLRCYGGSRHKQNAPASSRYKGVDWYKRLKLWRARIRANGKSLHLGFFATEEEGAYAYNIAALEVFGEFAYLNEIPIAK